MGALRVATSHEAEMQRLGRRARELREAAGMTQKQVAEAVGVSRQTVVRFEAGMHDLGASRLAAMAAALGIGPAAFWQ